MRRALPTFIQTLFTPRRNEKSRKSGAVSAGFALVLVGAVGCGDGSLIAAYCQLGHQCDNDLLVGGSEDSIDVCRTQIETDHRRLDANSEPICSDIKKAHLDYMTCVVRTAEEASTESEQCDGLNLIFSPCHNEHSTWYNLVGDAAGTCHE